MKAIVHSILFSLLLFLAISADKALAESPRLDFKRHAIQNLQQASCKLTVIQKDYKYGDTGEPRPIVQQLGVGDSLIIGPLLGGTMEYKNVQYSVILLGGQRSYIERKPYLNFYVELGIQHLEAPYQAETVKAQMLVAKSARPTMLIKQFEIPMEGFVTVAVSCEYLD